MNRCIGNQDIKNTCDEILVGQRQCNVVWSPEVVDLRQIEKRAANQHSKNGYIANKASASDGLITAFLTVQPSDHSNLGQ